MTRDEAAELADSAISLLKDLKRNWPETASETLVEHCGELLDLISGDVEKLNKGLDQIT